MENCDGSWSWVAQRWSSGKGRVLGCTPWRLTGSWGCWNSFLYFGPAQKNVPLKCDIRDSCLSESQDDICWVLGHRFCVWHGHEMRYPVEHERQKHLGKGACQINPASQPHAFSLLQPIRFPWSALWDLLSSESDNSFITSFFVKNLATDSL